MVCLASRGRHWPLLLLTRLSALLPWCVWVGWGVCYAERGEVRDGEGVGEGCEGRERVRDGEGREGKGVGLCVRDGEGLLVRNGVLSVCEGW